VELAERHQLIVARLQRSTRVSVTELADAVGTSEVTIRRDLEQLAGQGVLRRVRGGAVSVLPHGDETPFALRELQAVREKHRIAEVVGELVGDGEVVLVDSGTTGLAVARVLAGRRLTAMPLSLPAADALAGRPPTRVVLPGGELRQGELTVVGPLAEAGIRALRFDTAVITCCGLSVAAGLTVYDLADAAVKAAAIGAASRVVLVADSTKFARTAMAVVCPLSEVDVLVTDQHAPADTLAAITALGVEVHRG
jgi:DeoR/GlpR family transcriptional regulator of sugar metabolism